MPLGHPSRSRRHSRINTTHPPTVLSGWGTPPSRDWNHRAVCGCPYHCETPEERIGSRPLHSIVNRWLRGAPVTKWQPSRESSGLPCRLPCRGWTPELQPSLPNRHHFHFPSATGRSHGAHSRAGSRGVYRVQSPGPECPPLPSRLGAYQTSCQTPQADGGLYPPLYQQPASSRLFRIPPRYTHYRVPQNYPEHQYFYPSSSELLPFSLPSSLPRRRALDSQ